MTSFLPRQYGAWAALATAYVVGFAAGRNAGNSLNMPALLILIASISGFIARYWAGIYICRRKHLIRSLGFAAVSLVSAAAMVEQYGRTLIIPLGLFVIFVSAISIIIEMRGKDRTAVHEIIGMCGIGLVAPATFYAMTGEVTLKMFGLWILCSLFFGGGVFHVRYFTRDRVKGLAYMILYQGFAIVVALALVLSNTIPRLTLIAFVPAVAITVFHIVGRKFFATVSIRRVGYMELAHMLIFVVIVAISFSM